MKVKFINTAYTSIGFKGSYTGLFNLIDGEYIESSEGKLMTLQLPEKYITTGRVLISK
ncbi:hypothetical protein [Elizabethkingia anophelis]|uniref:hypothetical protein n=1 Tax=Elizabethkingia anophelis TaxID=1117645 RepID=UPI00162976EE|nr:hypothetical protein [Elizabethkingia anophelis]MCT4321839.1 hypothetical protein [Elizabethkingia anophelis]